MVREKDLGRSSTLSEKYIIDSDSDDPMTDGPSVQRNSSSSKSTEKKDGHTPSKSVARTDRNGNSGSQDGGNHAGDPHHSSLEESEETENARAVKRRKKRKVASMYGFSQGTGPQRANEPDRANEASLTTPERPSRPPNGYREMQPVVSDLDADVLEVLSGDLTNKQFWHITAPATVPMSSVERLSLEAISNGHPILTHGKKQYGFSKSFQNSIHLLVSDKTGRCFHRLNGSIARSYHLREIPFHPQSSPSDKAQSPEAMSFFAKRVPEAKPSPKQPQILTMRYKPFGADDTSTPSTKLSGNLASERSNIKKSPIIPSSPHRGTSKEGKKRNKEAKLPDWREGDRPEEDSMQIDFSSAQATTALQPTGETDLTRLEDLRNVGDVDEEKAIPAKRKRKKKKNQEDLVT